MSDSQFINTMKEKKEKIQRNEEYDELQMKLRKMNEICKTYKEIYGTVMKEEDKIQLDELITQTDPENETTSNLLSPSFRRKTGIPKELHRADSEGDVVQLSSGIQLARPKSTDIRKSPENSDLPPPSSSLAASRIHRQSQIRPEDKKIARKRRSMSISQSREQSTSPSPEREIVDIDEDGEMTSFKQSKLDKRRSISNAMLAQATFEEKL